MRWLDRAWRVGEATFPGIAGATFACVGMLMYSTDPTLVLLIGLLVTTLGRAYLKTPQWRRMRAARASAAVI